MFGKKNRGKAADHHGPSSYVEERSYGNGNGNGNGNGHQRYQPPPSRAAPAESNDHAAVKQPKLVFHCQQAHGSPTGLISGFTNVKELYEKIAECYDMPCSEVSHNITTKYEFIYVRLLNRLTGFVTLCSFFFFFSFVVIHSIVSSLPDVRFMN